MDWAAVFAKPFFCLYIYHLNQWSSPFPQWERIKRKLAEWVCKPNSVLRAPKANGVAAIHLVPESPHGLKRPTREFFPSASGGQEASGACSPPLFGLALDGVCQAAMSPLRRCALTAPFHPYPPSFVRRGERTTAGKPAEALAKAGGMFSVALSVGSPRLPVRKHPAQ